MLVVWELFATNYLESIALVEFTVLILTLEYHDLAVRQIAESLFLRHLQQQIKQILTLSTWMLRYLVAYYSSESIDLADGLTVRRTG